MLVIDASTAVDLCLAQDGFATLSDRDLVAPPLILSEMLSALHEMSWRGNLPAEMVTLALDRRREMPVQIVEPDGLREEARGIADEFGWAKTYDAEYVALAQLSGCRLVTADARLSRGAARLGFVITPADL